MTIPNVLTLMRLGLTPAVAAMAYAQSPAGRAWALGLFLFAMATDVADGMIARLPGQSSRLGLYLDPVVDKVIILTMFFVFADLGIIPLWIAALMMARELVVGGLRSAAATSGEVAGANYMGKTKALLQTACVCLGLGLRAFDLPASDVRMYVSVSTGFTVALAWVFAAVFVWKNRALLAEAQ